VVPNSVPVNTANFAVLSSCLNWKYKEECGMCPRYHSSTIWITVYHHALEWM